MKHLILTLLIAILSAGCANQDAKKAPPAPMYFQHTVKYSGETLASIADWYTGQISNWKAIAQANPSMKPERMRIGDIVNIPTHLVIKTKPYPKPVSRQKPKSDQTSPKQDSSSQVTETKPEEVPVVADSEQEAQSDEAPTSEEVKEEALPDSNTEATSPVTNTEESAPVNDEAERERLREKTRLELLNDVLGSEQPQAEAPKATE